jgi:hypothetical protein
VNLPVVAFHLHVICIGCNVVSWDLPYCDMSIKGSQVWDVILIRLNNTLSWILMVWCKQVWFSFKIYYPHIYLFYNIWNLLHIIVWIIFNIEEKIKYLATFVVNSTWSLIYFRFHTDYENIKVKEVQVYIIRTGRDNKFTE